jgi:hypothetical protein
MVREYRWPVYTAVAVMCVSCLWSSADQSLVAVQNAFRQRFPGRNPPSKSTILQNFRKYSEHGTSLNRNKNNSGRPRTARSQQNIAAVRRLLEQNPRDVSARRNPVQVSSTAFNRITNAWLGMASAATSIFSVVQLEMRRRPSFFGSCGNWRRGIFRNGWRSKLAQCSTVRT